MIGVIVMTHAGLASEFLAAAEMIIGPVEKVESISINRQMPVEEAKGRLQQAVGRVGADDEGVLILTDLFGGTPTNISAEFLGSGTVEVLTGVNLPMLIKCIGSRQDKPLEELTMMLKEYARDAIIRPTDLLRKSG